MAAETELIKTPEARPLAPLAGRATAPSARKFRRGPQVFAGALPEEITPEVEPAREEQPRLWLPVIPADRKRALLELHRAAAVAWTQGLRGRLRHGDQIRFDGFSFESCARLAAAQAVGAVATLFAVEGTRSAGGVLADARLAAYLAGRYPESVDEAPAASDDPSVSPSLLPSLTSLESALALRAIDDVVSQLSGLYATAGIGSLRKAGRGAALAETPLFAPTDYLAVFRYSIGAAEARLNLTVVANVDLIGAIRGEPAAIRESAGSERVARLAAAIPVRAAIVLGSWSVAIGELAALKAGDEIVLPDGADAWLEAAGIRLRPLQVEVAGQAVRAYQTARVATKGAANGPL